MRTLSVITTLMMSSLLYYRLDSKSVYNQVYNITWKDIFFGNMNYCLKCNGHLFLVLFSYFKIENYDSKC